jgi:hypothetical protein
MKNALAIAIVTLISALAFAAPSKAGNCQNSSGYYYQCY